jgi:hypothetical protein
MEAHGLMLERTFNTNDKQQLQVGIAGAKHSHISRSIQTTVILHTDHCETFTLD